MSRTESSRFGRVSEDALPTISEHVSDSFHSQSYANFATSLDSRSNPVTSSFQISEPRAERHHDVSLKTIQAGCYSFLWTKKQDRARNIFMVICVLYVVYNVLQTSKGYFKYETGVSVSIDKLFIMNRSLPGVTICNKNLISKEKALAPHNVPGFNDMLQMFSKGQVRLDDIYNVKEKTAEASNVDAANKTSNSSAADDVTSKQETTIESESKKDLLTDEEEEDLTDQQENPRTRNSRWRERKKIEIGIYEDFMSAYYGKLPVSRQIKDGPEPHKFLIHLTCNQKDWPEVDSNGNIKPSTFDCATKKSIHTAQGKGNCITLFHEASSTSSNLSTSVGKDFDPLFSLGNDWKSNPKLLPVRIGKEKDFVPLELIKVVLDFGPENYTDLRKEPGGEIMFHDNRTIPLESSLSYRLEPGKEYMFLLKKSTTLSLPPPFTTRCTDYYGSNWIRYQRKEAMLTDDDSLPLSRTHCIEQCILRKTLFQSRCWPKQIPFVASSLDVQSNRRNESLQTRASLLWCHRQKNCKYCTNT